MQTTNRGYKKPIGQLEEDIGRIDESFEMIDRDVHALHLKLEEENHLLKQMLQNEEHESVSFLGNLSLLNMEQTQNIKIGVEI